MPRLSKRIRRANSDSRRRNRANEGSVQKHSRCETQPITNTRSIRAFSEHLIRDVHVAAVRVVGPRNVERSCGWNGRGGREWRGRQVGDSADGRDEPIAAPVRGLDVLRLLDLVVEGLADLADAHLQRGVADEDLRPAGVEQLLFRHETAGVLDQVAQDVVSLRRERHDASVARELRAREIQRARAEKERAVARRCKWLSCGFPVHGVKFPTIRQSGDVAINAIGRSLPHDY